MNINVGVYESGRKRPEYTIDSDLSGELSLMDLLEFLRASLIITADTVLKEEQALGFDKTPVVAVDGKVGKDVNKVNPFGTIDITARADMGDILIETYTALLQRSPVLTGRYKSANFVFWNGKQVATDMPSLQAWLNTDPQFDDKDLIRFVNVEPYARKLERLGVTGQRTQTRTVRASKKGVARGITRVAAPNGDYFLTARAIRAKYKRNSTIAFSFISGAALGISGTFQQKRAGKPGRPYLYPTITISVNENGSY